MVTAYFAIDKTTGAKAKVAEYGDCLRFRVFARPRLYADMEGFIAYIHAENIAIVTDTNERCRPADLVEAIRLCRFYRIAAMPQI